MFVRRFYDNRLAQASYLIGCEASGEAIVVDPARDISPYLECARTENLRITRVTETHIHADFVSGTRELAAATRAVPLLSAEGGLDWQYEYAGRDHAVLLHDGDVIVFGGVRLAVWHTPGHTPEHLAFVVTDAARSNEPVALLSGDFVFVGDVGRPDLLERVAGVVDSKDGAARALFHSLQRLAALPDHVQVWPGHGAGSACGKALGSLPTSTLGYERRTNWAFSVATEAAFIAAVLEGQPVPPPYFARMKTINRAGPPVLGVRALAALHPPALPRALKTGLVVDTRLKDAFAGGHVAGTLNIPLTRAFTKWAGWLVPPDRDVYLIALDAATAADAQAALASIGIDRVAGAFGPEVIDEARQSGAARVTHRGTMADAARLQDEGTVILDLRDPDEWNAGHLEGALFRPLGTLPETLAAMERTTPLAVHCQGGTRSAIGASMLEQMGFVDVTDLSDGWSAFIGGACDDNDAKSARVTEEGMFTRPAL